MTGIPINLWGRDLLQQGGTQITNPAIPRIANEETKDDNGRSSWRGIDTGDQDQPQAEPIVQKQDNTETEFPNL